MACPQPYADHEPAHSRGPTTESAAVEGASAPVRLECAPCAAGSSPEGGAVQARRVPEGHDDDAEEAKLRTA